MNGSKFTIGLATVVMLVLLRLNIGWHFFCEGLSHTDPHWSSEGFLRSATGPLAPQFRAVLPDYYGFKEVWAKGNSEQAVEWFEGFGNHLADYGRKFSDHYQLDENQKADAEKILKLRQLQIKDWIVGNMENIQSQFYERDRQAANAKLPSAEAVPYQQERNAKKAKELEGAMQGWLAQLKAIENDYRGDLAQLRTAEQIAKGPVSEAKTTLQKVDRVMAYGILAIGACLILGLFTRVAALLGALFLVSVVLTQPFWVSTAQPTFNQWVEMFALLMLATTNVGKWGGLDFFLSCMFGRCCQQSSASTLASASILAK